MSRTVALLITLLALSLDSAADARMRNVILIIGDGFDDQHVTMGRNYLAGMSGKLKVDDLPFRASVQVETVTPSGAPSYVADSANTATSLATGAVTSMGRIATDIGDRDVTTIGERAIAAGFKVGLVTHFVTHRCHTRVFFDSRLGAQL